MYRQSYPYKRELNENENKEDDIECDEKGLFFAAWSHSLEEINTSLERMMGKWATGKQKGLDNLFKITRSIFNGYFYAPSLNELVLLCDDQNIRDEVNQWIDIKYNEIENKCVLPNENYIADKFIRHMCLVCRAEQSVLSDDESEIFFCVECRNVGLKQ